MERVARSSGRRSSSAVGVFLRAMVRWIGTTTTRSSEANDETIATRILATNGGDGRGGGRRAGGDCGDPKRGAGVGTRDGRDRGSPVCGLRSKQSLGRPAHFERRRA